MAKLVFRLDLEPTLAYTQPSIANYGSPWAIERGACVMAKRCQISGKTVMSGNNVSHANNRTRRRFLPNLQATRMYSEVLNRQISYSDPMAFGEAHQLSVIALRTVEHDGVAIS